MEESTGSTSNWGYEGGMIFIHDMVPTHERLHKIRMVLTDLCRHCNTTDTLRHRLTECGEGSTICEWTRQRITTILRTDPRRLLAAWLLRPDLKLWPPTRHCAVLWVLTNFVIYRLQQWRTLMLPDYFDFLRRAIWKIYNTNSRSTCLGNYLHIYT